MCWNNGNIISVLRLYGARRPILPRLASHSPSPCHDFTPFYIRNRSSSAHTHTHTTQSCTTKKKGKALVQAPCPQPAPALCAQTPRCGFFSVYSSWWKTCHLFLSAYIWSLTRFFMWTLHLCLPPKLTSAPRPRRGQSNKAAQSQEGTKVVSVFLPADTRSDYNTFTLRLKRHQAGLQGVHTVPGDTLWKNTPKNAHWTKTRWQITLVRVKVALTNTADTTKRYPTL